MADSTEALQTSSREYSDSGNVSKHVVKTNEDVYQGTFAAVSLTTGLVENADDVNDLVNGAIFKDDSIDGRPLDNKTGDGSVTWTLSWGKRIPSYPVTGASAVTDFGKLVYATDNQTLTLTRPSAGSPVGRVVRYISGTNCEIQMFTLMEALNFNNLPSNKQYLCLGTVESVALEGTSALELITDLPMLTPGKIVDFFAIVKFDSTSAAGAQTFTLDIGSTAVTGASISLDKDDGQGSIVSSTAITANNTFARGDTISLLMSGSGTGWTASERSMFEFWITIAAE